MTQIDPSAGPGAPDAGGPRGAAAPRIAAVSPGERDERQRQLLAGAGGDEAANLFATLVRDPKLFEAWLPFCLHLLRCRELEPRHRELIILRTAWLCDTYYEWAHHVGFGLKVGLTPDEIAALTGQSPAIWTPDEIALIDAVDELNTSHVIGEHTWKRLAGFLNVEQLITVPMLVGHYTMLAGTLNSLRIAPDAGIADPTAIIGWDVP